MPKKDSSRPRTVVFTQGSQSTIVACDGKVTEYAVDPLAKELLVDTNGAGDAFTAGIIYGEAKGLSTYDTVKFSSACALITIQHKNAVHPEICEELVKNTLAS